MENKRKSITEIKAEFSNADVNAVKQVIEKYAEDDREGVKKLILSVKKRIAAYQKSSTGWSICLNMRDSMLTVSISVELMR